MEPRGPAFAVVVVVVTTAGAGGEVVGTTDLPQDCWRKQIWPESRMCFFEEELSLEMCWSVQHPKKCLS